MTWQSSTINPTVTTPADDIGKIKNDLQQLRTVIGGGTDADIPNVAATFTPQGTHGSTRSVQGRLRESYSLSDQSGAAPGGEVSVQLTQALAEATTTDAYGTWKQTVALPAGWWSLAAGFTLPRGASLVGQGLESSRIDASAFPTASGNPMMTTASHPDWHLSRIRFEGGGKAAGLLFDGNCYFGKAQQIHVNGFKKYALWLNESAQTLWDTCSFYNASASTDVAVMCDGGSMQTLLNCMIDSRSVGMQSAQAAGGGTYATRSGNPSGPNSLFSNFGACYPAHKVANGDGPWMLLGNYYEGVTGVTAGQVFDIGSFNGPGGSTPPNVIWNYNRVANANMQDVYVYNANVFVAHHNYLGVSVQLTSNVVYADVVNPMLAAGKSFNATPAATGYYRASNLQMFWTNQGLRRDTISGTDGVVDEALTKALTGYVQRTSYAQNFKWVAASTGRYMALDANGNLLLNGASAAGGTSGIAAPGPVLSGNATATGYGNWNSAQLEGPSGRGIANHIAGTASGALYMGWGYNGAAIGSITQSGTTAVLYNTTSDRRLKANIRDAGSSGELVDAIRVRAFDWRAEGGESVSHGFIAQELAEVFPSAVHRGDSGEEVTDAWGVDPSKLVALLLAEVQALRARVAKLEAA